MSDISLTSSMRANLLSLQSTVQFMGRTQERLASGEKVNSALDNPTNFFTAQSHTSRANDLLGFKDGISESIQTIKAADAAVTGITKLIESAKAVAEAAKGVVNSATTNQTITFGNTALIQAGDTISIGGQAYTAVTSATSVDNTHFFAGGTAAQAASSLAAAAALTPVVGVTVTDNGNGTVNVKHADNSAMLAGDVDVSATHAGATESAIANNGTELQAKIVQYNTIMTQINDLQADAFYKGKNLLGGAGGGTNDMTVRFGNSHTLTVASFDGDVAGLGMDAAATTWASETTIGASITKMEDALSTLRIESSKLSSNLSIVQTRSDWISNVANVLQTGADNLVNADTNEEGANMLMLQTRQSLSTSALSMAAQSAQSVLRLFQ